MVKILDCTIRDGGHDTNWEFSDEYVSKLLECQNLSKVSYCEIGYRNHVDNKDKGRFYNCGPELLKFFSKLKGCVKVGVMVDTSRFSEDDFIGNHEDCLDFIRIAGKPFEIDKTLSVAEILHKKGYKVFVQLMDISNVDEKGYITLYNWKNKDILESLYFADSYGKLYPQDIERYYNKLQMLGYKNISFHAHNKINMALDNTLKAIEMGAYSVDVTSNGKGRYGGNLRAEELFSYFSEFPSAYYENFVK